MSVEVQNMYWNWPPRQESIFDRIIYDYERKLSRAKNPYPYLRDRTGLLVYSIRYYYKMMSELGKINPEKFSSLVFDDSNKSPKLFSRFKDLVATEGGLILDYFGALAILYGRALLNGELSHTEEQRYLQEKKGTNRLKELLALYESAASANLVPSLKNVHADWNRKDSVLPPSDIVLNPWLSAPFNPSKIYQEKMYHDFPGLAGTVLIERGSFKEQIKPVLARIIGKNKDALVLGNVASGTVDAGIITAAIRDLFPKVRTSLGFTRHSPIKEYDPAPDLQPIENEVVSLAKESEWPVIFVDAFASSGNTVNIAVNSGLLGPNVFGFVSTNNRFEIGSLGLRELYHDNVNDIAVYTHQ